MKKTRLTLVGVFLFVFIISNPSWAQTEIEENLSQDVNFVQSITSQLFELITQPLDQSVVFSQDISHELFEMLRQPLDQSVVFSQNISHELFEMLRQPLDQSVVFSQDLSSQHFSATRENPLLAIQFVNSVDFELDTDRDDDRVSNNEDNCLEVYNPKQKDDDDDGIGNACDFTKDDKLKDPKPPKVK